MQAVGEWDLTLPSIQSSQEDVGRLARSRRCAEKRQLAAKQAPCYKAQSYNPTRRVASSTIAEAVGGGGEGSLYSTEDPPERGSGAAIVAKVAARREAAASILLCCSGDCRVGSYFFNDRWEMYDRTRVLTTSLQLLWVAGIVIVAKAPYNPQLCMGEGVGILQRIPLQPFEGLQSSNSEGARGREH